MEISLAPGSYVVAVSGGVDSMVLLHLLVQRQLPVVSRPSSAKAEDSRQGTDNSSCWRLLAAHFDHGIRPDSAEDRQLVQRAAEAYGLPFVYEEGRLGVNVSEARARQARYDFLRRVRVEHGAAAIITAHHQDDLLETAILNLLRGTGPKGLAALRSHDGLLRPLLHASKSDIRAHAQAHHLAWREDSTNGDERYRRNYIRRRLLPRFSEADRAKLLGIIEAADRTNAQLDDEVETLLDVISSGRALDRQAFITLSHAVAREVLAGWLRSSNLADFDRRTLERVVVAAKTKAPGAKIDVLHGASLLVTKTQLALTHHER